MLWEFTYFILFMLRKTSRPLKSCYSSQMHFKAFHRSYLKRHLHRLKHLHSIDWKAPTMSADDVVKTLRQLTLDRVAECCGCAGCSLLAIVASGMKPGTCLKSALVTACLQCAQRPLEVIFHCRLLIGRNFTDSSLNLTATVQSDLRTY